jgi:hypothetical protein
VVAVHASIEKQAEIMKPISKRKRVSMQSTNNAGFVVDQHLGLSPLDSLDYVDRCPEPVRLVARVYGDASLEMQRDILLSVAQPLGVLSLVAVANGVFSKVFFRDSDLTPNISLEQVSSIALTDVWTLIDFAYQVSGDAFNGLAQLIPASPSVAATASALLLLTWIAQRKKRRRCTDQRNSI